MPFFFSLFSSYSFNTFFIYQSWVHEMCWFGFFFSILCEEHAHDFLFFVCFEIINSILDGYVLIKWICPIQIGVRTGKFNHSNEVFDCPVFFLHLVIISTGMNHVEFHGKNKLSMKFLIILFYLNLVGVLFVINVVWNYLIKMKILSNVQHVTQYIHLNRRISLKNRCNKWHIRVLGKKQQYVKLVLHRQW